MGRRPHEPGAAGHHASRALPVGDRRQSDRRPGAGDQYAQQIDFGADLDLGKLAGLPGGQVHFTFTDRAGRSLAAEDIGNLISVQEIFGGGQNFRLAELSYQQSLFDDRLEAKLGWIHAADDFTTSPIYCYFQNNGFCGQPAGIPIDSGYTTFPVGSWGGVVKLRPQPTSISRPAPTRSIPRWQHTTASSWAPPAPPA